MPLDLPPPAAATGGPGYVTVEDLSVQKFGPGSEVKNVAGSSVFWLLLSLNADTPGPKSALSRSTLPWCVVLPRSRPATAPQH